MTGDPPEPEDPTDVALKQWRQGDYCLDFKAVPFLRSAMPGEDGYPGPRVDFAPCPGVMVMTQSCELRSPTAKNPNVVLCALEQAET